MDNPVFTWCPIEVVMDHRLTLIETRVLMALFSFRNKDTGITCVKRDTISSRCAYTPQTVSRATTSLQKKGWLFKDGKGGFSKATDYTITVPELETVSGSETVSEPSTTTVSGSGTTTVSEPVTRIRTELELSRNKASSHPDDVAIAKFVLQEIRKVNPKHKQPNMDRWADEIRKMREIDKRTPDEIRSTFTWAHGDDFWGKNILSPAKLRKQFDTLVANMVTTKTQQTNRLQEFPDA